MNSKTLAMAESGPGSVLSAAFNGKELTSDRMQHTPSAAETLSKNRFFIVSPPISRSEKTAPAKRVVNFVLNPKLVNLP